MTWYTVENNEAFKSTPNRLYMRDAWPILSRLKMHGGRFSFEIILFINEQYFELITSLKTGSYSFSASENVVKIKFNRKTLQ